jgi:hypothetical protein
MDGRRFGVFRVELKVEEEFVVRVWCMVRGGERRAFLWAELKSGASCSLVCPLWVRQMKNSEDFCLLDVFWG